MSSAKLPLPTLRRRRSRRGYARDLLLHLVRREVAATHRFTLLGWAWPLTKQLAQLAVLVFVFSEVLDLAIEDFPVFVFTGLVAWGWFSSGLSSATSSLLAQRHLVLQPGFPVPLIPLVALAVPLFDVGVAMPVLLAMVAAAGTLAPVALLLPLLVAVQLLLMSGLAWLAAAATVYLRDVRDVVGVALTLLFYLTPVFYDREISVPPEYHWLLALNPLTTLIEAWRALLLEGRAPPPGPLLTVAGVSALIALTGYAAFRRLRPGFVDEL
jgi:lipopolysaccharide transport system permease protein